MTRPSDLAALTSRVLDPLAPADRYASEHDVLDSVGALEAEDDLYSGNPDPEVIAVMGDAYGADEFGSLWGSIKRRVKRTAKGAYHVVPKGLRHAAESAVGAGLDVEVIDLHGQGAVQHLGAILGQPLNGVLHAGAIVGVVSETLACGESRDAISDSSLRCAHCPRERNKWTDVRTRIDPGNDEVWRR